MTRRELILRVAAGLGGGLALFIAGCKKPAEEPKEETEQSSGGPGGGPEPDGGEAGSAPADPNTAPGPDGEAVH